MHRKKIYVFDVYIELPLTKKQLGLLAFTETTLRWMNPVLNPAATAFAEAQQALKKIERSHQSLMHFIQKCYQPAEASHLIEYYQNQLDHHHGMRVNAPVFNYFGYSVTTPMNEEAMWLLSQGLLKTQRYNLKLIEDLGDEDDSHPADVEALLKQEQKSHVDTFKHLDGTLRLTQNDPHSAKELLCQFSQNFRDAGWDQADDAQTHFFIRDVHPCQLAGKIHLCIFFTIWLLLNFEQVNEVMLRLILMLYLY